MSGPTDRPPLARTASPARPTCRRAALALALLPLAACTVTHVDLDYSPSPAELFVSTRPAATTDIGDEDTAPLARVLVSVVAAERPNRNPDLAFELDVRVRVENFSEHQMTVDAGDVLLVGDDLESFGAVRLSLGADAAAVERAVVAPGTSEVVRARFPLGGRRPGDLEGLNLDFVLDVGGRRVRLGSTFARERPTTIYQQLPPPYYGYPYYYGSGRSRTTFFY